jgi:asparagine synthase (glutamine-hydrolysing)
VDLKYYLPGLGLAYMDKASMAASVEVRVPLIDDDVVDFVARLSDSYKVQGLRTKVILREAMKGRIPDAVLRRPKAPFAAPIRTWLRRDLAPMIAECLSPSRIKARGLLNPAVVRRMLQEHQSGREDHSLRIWALLTLEIWLQEFFDKRSRFTMPDTVEEMPLTMAANQAR